MGRLIEINIDGLIGPTHHFGGLGVGNVASQSSRWRESHPAAAAREGLHKMQRVADLGVPQFFLPPPSRPNWDWLARLGYSGERRDLLKRCMDESPQILSAAYSSSFMWTANAATVAPLCDTTDGRTILCPANLCSSLHRGMEHEERTDQLRVLTQGMNPCEVVDALPSSQPLRDEGAANHMRLCGSGNNRNRAVHVFVHEPASESDSLSPLRYVSRQSVVASHHVSRKLTLAEEKCVFIEQSQRAINAGVFHNDVIATSHGNLLLCHELAFTNTPQSIERMSEKYRQVVGEELICEIVTESMLPIEESVRSYLFNSQILSKSDGSFHLLCPSECGESERVRTVIEGWLASESNPISSVETIGVQESMSNGGGPACLRLRLDVDEEQVSQLEPRWRFTPERHSEIARWIDNYYPARLCIDDLARWDFAEHAMAAVYAFA